MGEVVDMPCQGLQFTFANLRQDGLVITGLNRADSIAHGAEGLRQVAGQAAGKE